MATARTWLEPRCWATSATMSMAEAVSVAGALDLESVEDLGQLAFGKLDVEDRADDLDDLADGAVTPLD